jgi:hypothetical protein
MISSLAMWVSEQSVEASAEPDSIWRIWLDIPAWPQWLTDIEAVEADGPLVAGTAVTMVDREAGPLKSRIADVVDGRSFTLSFDFDGTTLSVDYRLAIWAGKTRIYHRMVVEGPNDQLIGQQMAPSVEQRIPSILRGLVRLAESP